MTWYNRRMTRWILRILFLLSLVVPLQAARPDRCAVWIEGSATAGAIRSRQLEEALVFRLRHATPSPRLVDALQAASRSRALALARTKGYDRLVILDAASGQGSIHAPHPAGRVLAQTGGQGKAGLPAIERLALAYEGRTAPHVLIDIVFVIDTGGAMHRLVNDAADTISRMGITLQNGLPVPDVHWGLMTFSSSDTLAAYDLTPSSERIAQLVRERRGGYGDGNVPLDAVIQRLAHSITWRAGATRYAVLYTNGGISTGYHQLEQLSGPGIRLVTVPADGASTETHRALKILAERSRGHSFVPEYLVRYRDQASLDRAFVLRDRTLLRMTHDIPERNWKRYYSGLREPAGGSRRFRAGTIDESIAILGRSGRQGIRIREVQSSLGNAIISAINGLQPRDARIATAHPDALCTALHGKQRISMPVVMERITRASPQAGTWLGISIIPDYYAEGRFRVHPQSLQLFPAQFAPPAMAQREWSAISRNPTHSVGDALFTPGRVFLRVRDLRIIPIMKKPYILEP